MAVGPVYHSGFPGEEQTLGWCDPELIPAPGPPPTIEPLFHQNLWGHATGMLPSCSAWLPCPSAGGKAADHRGERRPGGEGRTTLKGRLPIREAWWGS